MRSPMVRAVPTDCFFVAMGSTRSLSLIPSSRSIFRTTASPRAWYPRGDAPREPPPPALRVHIPRCLTQPSRLEPLLDDGGHGGASDDGGHDLVPELRAARADGQDRTLDCDVPRPGHLGSAQDRKST